MGLRKAGARDVRQQSCCQKLYCCLSEKPGQICGNFSMPSIAEALAIAAQMQQSGRLAEAEQICQQVVAADGMNAEAWHLLGAIAYQVGNVEGALACWQRAAALAPQA